MENSYSSTPIVIALLFLWVVLVLALVYFHKKLNAETNGQYTVQRIVLGPGGLRDRLRQGVGVLETRFGIHIWPRPREDEENIRGNEEDDDQGESQDKANDSYDEEDEHNDGDKDDSSSDYSSIDLRERAERQKKEKKKEEKKEVEEKPEEAEAEVEGAVGGEQEKTEEVKNEEKLGLLDLKPFTGSAIWSSESKEASDGNDLTAL